MSQSMRRVILLGLLIAGFSGLLLIEPIAQAVFSPNGSNPGDIPNEDSQDFEFDDTNASEIMTPRADMFVLDINEDLKIEEIIDSGFSRIPVIRDDIDDVIGVLAPVETAGLDDAEVERLLAERIEAVLDDVEVAVDFLRPGRFRGLCWLARAKPSTKTPWRLKIPCIRCSGR